MDETYHDDTMCDIHAMRTAGSSPAGGALLVLGSHHLNHLDVSRVHGQLIVSATSVESG
jgi:hypothetical protein